jgi:mono/diheme cytochrome c family protein
MTNFLLSLLGTNAAILRFAMLLVAAWVVSLGVCLAGGQYPGPKKEWLVPAEPAQKANPVSPDESSLAAGRRIYLAKCTACHGKTGDGDGDDAIAFGFYPAKLSDPGLRGEPDGALYWRITTGKKPMPEFGTRLSATDRWNVVNYIRTLSQRKERE